MTPWDALNLLPVTGLAWTAVLATAALAARVGWLVWVARRHRPTGHLVRVKAPPEVDPRGAARLWANLTGLAHHRLKRLALGQPHVVWEYAWTGGRLDVRVWAPDETVAALMSRAVAAAWPGAACEVTEADPPLPQSSLARWGSVSFGPDSTAINVDQATEPLRGVLEAAQSTRSADAAIVQVFARPASPRRLGRLRRSARGESGAGLGGLLLDLIDPSAGSRTPSRGGYVDRDVVTRSRGPMFETVVRCAAATTHRQRQQTARREVAARYGRIAAALCVFAGPGGVKRRRTGSATPSRRQFSPAVGRLLTVEELAALAHLPADVTLPQLERAGARPVAPVAQVVTGGRNTKTLGDSAVTGRAVAVSAADARHHVHIVGATGTGKSTLLSHMVLADIRDGRGVIAIDPKGDLIDDILDRLNPEDVTGRLHIIDPNQTRHVGINPLVGGDPDLVTDHFVSICRSIWPRHWGSRADDILRSGVLTLMESRRPKLEVLPLLLTSKQARSPITAAISGPLAGFWQWYDMLSVPVQSQAVGPVLSRIRTLMTRRFVNDTIGAPSTDVDIGRVLDHGGILLVRIPKGQIGDDACRLLGSVVVARTWQAATARSALPEHARRDASIYIDEFHNFVGLPQALDEVLAEARGYRLSLVLAHQHMAQLGRELQFATSANTRTKVYFHTSPEDGRLLSRHTLPHLSEYDLSHLEAYRAACKVFTAGSEQPAFTLATRPPTEPVGQAARIRADATPPAPDDGDQAEPDHHGTSSMDSMASVPIPGSSPDPSPDPGVETPPQTSTHREVTRQVKPDSERD